MSNKTKFKDETLRKRTMKNMKKFFGLSLLGLLIVAAISLAMDLGGFRSMIGARTGWFRLDTAAAETAARSALGSIDRQVKTLESLSGQSLDEKTAKSLVDDSHIQLYERLPGDYVYVYSVDTTTSPIQCSLVAKTSEITCQ